MVGQTSSQQGQFQETSLPQHSLTNKLCFQSPSFVSPPSPVRTMKNSGSVVALKRQIDCAGISWRAVDWGSRSPNGRGAHCRGFCLATTDPPYSCEVDAMVELMTERLADLVKRKIKR